MPKTILTKITLNGDYTYSLKEFADKKFVIFRSNNRKAGADFSDEVGKFNDEKVARENFEKLEEK